MRWRVRRIRQSGNRLRDSVPQWSFRCRWLRIFRPIGISDDPALLRAITEAIRESARRHHAVSVACWPNVAYRLYSSDGQPDGEPNDALLAGFADAGWMHGGFHTGYDVVCQWMYVKDLTGITNGKELPGAKLESVILTAIWWRAGLPQKRRTPCEVWNWKKRTP